MNAKEAKLKSKQMKQNDERECQELKKLYQKIADDKYEEEVQKIDKDIKWSIEQRFDDAESEVENLNAEKHIKRLKQEGYKVKSYKQGCIFGEDFRKPPCTVLTIKW